jgi:hypothetical protein
MNITVPPVVPVPTGLRFVHPYLPPPPPHPHSSAQSAASVAQVAQVASSNSASPVSASSGPSSIQQQVPGRQHPPTAPSPASVASNAAAAYTRDVYRNASPNVSIANLAGIDDREDARGYMGWCPMEVFICSPSEMRFYKPMFIILTTGH